MCRSLMPMISAACHHVIFFAMARKITSCTFIAHRGLRVREHACHVLLPSPPEKRTDHVLSQPDISCANDTETSTGCLPAKSVPVFLWQTNMRHAATDKTEVWQGTLALMVLKTLETMGPLHGYGI